MHTSGWFKNPDYERCYHLSLSFWDMRTRTPRPFEETLAKTWVRAFFGQWERFLWVESGGKNAEVDAEVRHYRVMCDPFWQPIIPRGEVYTRDFTEKGWQSWSDRRYAEEKARGEKP